MNDHEPRIVKHVGCWCVRKRTNGEAFFWNSRRGFISEKLIHGPSAQNPKASYFRSYANAERALTQAVDAEVAAARSAPAARGGEE